MKLKLILTFTDLSAFILYTGNKLYAVLFLLIGPVISYIVIRFCMDGFISLFTGPMYGSKTTRKPVEELSLIRKYIANHNYKEALEMLDDIESDSIEVHKLKMELLYENFQALKQSLEIGLGLLEAEQLDYEHVEILNLCVDICLELNNRSMAICLLKNYGPKLPGESAVRNSEKRLKALSS